MIILSIALHQFCSNIRTDFGEEALHRLKMSSGKDFSPIFGGKHQMDMEQKHTMTTRAKLMRGFCHTPIWK